MQRIQRLPIFVCTAKAQVSRAQHKAMVVPRKEVFGITGQQQRLFRQQSTVCRTIGVTLRRKGEARPVVLHKEELARGRVQCVHQQ